MSVKVQELTKVYGEQRAVDAISFEVKSGEIVGFLGPNGEGKSTTMKMLTCYITPTSGEAWVSGSDIYEQSLEARKKIGYLPENNPLYLDMYVKEYLHFIAGIHQYKGNVNQRVAELIELTGLQVERHKKIRMLSKGYRQRVGLAQALLHEPEVLILDEPTTGLDPNQIIEIRNLIKEVGKEKTVIFSTHILQEVQAICSRVLIINKGKIVADSPTEELMAAFSGKVSLRVEFKNAVKENELKHIEGVENIEKKGNTWVITSDGSNDIREQVFQMAVRDNNIIYEMQQESQSLEKVFQQLTRRE
jgi:ABC-2 type transport system ATP-binding protein